MKHTITEMAVNTKTRRGRRRLLKTGPFVCVCFSSALLFKETEPDDGEEGFDPVFPPDFFPFGIGPTTVADGHFIDAKLPLGDFCRELRLEAEAVRLES